MKYAVVYSSNTGNTRELAETLKNHLEGSCVYFGAPSQDALEADVIFIGFWTDKGTCDGSISDFLKSLEGKTLFLFGTAGFGGGQDYFQKILGNVKPNIGEGNSLAGEFMCQGKMPMAVRRRYEAMPEGANRTASLENFDRGQSHPDKADLAALLQAVKAAGLM